MAPKKKSAASSTNGYATIPTQPLSTGSAHEAATLHKKSRGTGKRPPPLTLAPTSTTISAEDSRKRRRGTDSTIGASNHPEATSGSVAEAYDEQRPWQKDLFLADEVEAREAREEPPALPRLRQEIGGYPVIPWCWHLDATAGASNEPPEEIFSRFLADAEQALCGMCCRLLPHITVKTNTCFLSVGQRGQTPPTTPTLRGGQDDDDDDPFDADHLLRRVQDEHGNIYQRLRGTIAAACTLGHRACQVLWGAEGCGKSRLLRLAAADTRRRPNTLVFFLDGATLRSEEAAVSVMADQMFDFLQSPSSEGVRQANWSVRTGTFDFGRVFHFPERLEAAEVARSEKREGSSSFHRPSSGMENPTAIRHGGLGPGHVEAHPNANANASADEDEDEDEGDDFGLHMTNTTPHHASASAANALPYLHAALLLLRQHRVSILVCIRHVDQFSVWCDQLLYVLAGLLHDAGQEASGECGGFIFLLTNAAADMRQLEKRLSSRLTPETRYVPLLQWTPRRLVRATVQLIRELFLCCYDAHAILIGEPEAQRRDGEEGGVLAGLLAPPGASLHAMAVLQQKVVALSHAFPLDILYTSPSRANAFLGSTVSAKHQQHPTTARDADGDDAPGQFAPPSSHQHDFTCHHHHLGIYHHHALVADVMVRLCDAMLLELRAGGSSPIDRGGAEEQGKDREDGEASLMGARAEETIASVLTSAKYEDIVYEVDTSPSVAISTAAQVFRRAFAGALSVLNPVSREAVAVDLLNTLRHSDGGGGAVCASPGRLDIHVALPSPQAILGAFHRLHYYEADLGTRRGSRRTVALSATTWSRSVEALYRFIAGAINPPLPAFLLDDAAGVVDMDVDDEEALLRLLHEDFRAAANRENNNKRGNSSEPTTGSSAFVEQEGARLMPLVLADVAVPSRRSAWWSPARLAIGALIGGGGVDGVGVSATAETDQESQRMAFSSSFSVDSPSDAYDLLQDGRWVAWGFASRESFLLLCLLALTYAANAPPRSVEDVLEDVVTSGLGRAPLSSRAGVASQRRDDEKNVYRAALLQLQLWHFVSVTPGSELVQLTGNAQRIRDMLGYVLVQHPDWCEVQLGLDAKEILHARSLLLAQ